MTDQQILDKLKSVFQTVNPKQDLDKVTMESRLFEDLGVDSLTLLLLTLSIESEFGITLESDARFKTVAEVVKYISGKVA
jgi:acyl carrier protein